MRARTSAAICTVFVLMGRMRAACRGSMTQITAVDAIVCGETILSFLFLLISTPILGRRVWNQENDGRTGRADMRDRGGEIVKKYCRRFWMSRYTGSCSFSLCDADLCEKKISKHCSSHHHLRLRILNQAECTPSSYLNDEVFIHSTHLSPVSSWETEWV